MASEQGRPTGHSEDPLAYGEDYDDREQNYEEQGDGTGDRGIIGDTYRKFRGKPPKKPGESPGIGTFIFDKLHDAVHDIGSELGKKFDGKERPSHQASGQANLDARASANNRYGSFASPKVGNEVKWFVDGCGYMWAVSLALQRATESIWILDWWLSPELYLRRPPSRNEQYRLDRMLQAAAERGVKVNVIVYKEVTQALTRKYLSPLFKDYLHSLLPRGVDPISRGITGLGLAAVFASLEHIEREKPLILPPLPVSSSHTKHALESLHPNIAVFRHPDHLPDAQTLQSSFFSSLQNISLSAKTASTLPIDALKSIYGMNEDVILYWAHHEKLLLVDGKTAFMGGLDLCYGRWDTNQHPLADCHPANLDEIVFPGQDYNNARIMDFQDVAHWQNNKLDRRFSSRMGWSDISVSLQGRVVEDLRTHFVQRWNFIFDEKYDVRKDKRYSRISLNSGFQNNPGTAPPPTNASMGSYPYQQSTSAASVSAQPYGPRPSQYPPPPPGPPPPQQVASDQAHNPYASGPLQPQQQNYQGQTPYFPPPPTSSRGLEDGQAIEETRGPAPSAAHHHHDYRRYEQEAEGEARSLGRKAHGRYEEGKQHLQEHYLNSNELPSMLPGRPGIQGMPCQIVRSCTKWSHGVPTEHSVANAYISVIENSQHFIYIENQFFITATTDAQKPVKNKIGAAIVERVLRAARAGAKFKIIVIIPAIPGFAGDLKADSSLGTRAIMEYQYNSINRGGHSIMESIGNAGFDPTEYIRFYNLRNYDRIDVGGPLKQAEKLSGITYEAARREHDDAVELPADQPTNLSRGDPGDEFAGRPNYQAYQKATDQMNRRQGLYTGDWDSVSECYMLGGRDIRSVPWDNGDIPEIDAFVTEELYIHSKVLIADDRVVICGSANLNDRSQLGTHDSEIAIVVEDQTPLDSFMNGRPHRASRFAATLRRQLFRKHLGLLAPQNMTKPDANFVPVGVPNAYDYGSPEDTAVTDPLADTFLALWNTRARTNTQIFSKIFHPVPDDSVRTWGDYDKFYEHFFKDAGQEAEGKDEKKRPSKYMWGHVVAEEFSPGEQGCREVKELLSQVRGTLVEMPLMFLIKEDIAKEGLALNAFTEEVYT